MQMPKINVISFRIIMAIIVAMFLSIDVYVGYQLFKSLSMPKQTVSAPVSEVLKYEETISMPRLPQSENKKEIIKTKTVTPAIEKDKPQIKAPTMNDEIKKWLEEKIAVENSLNDKIYIPTKEVAPIVQNNQVTINTIPPTIPQAVQSPIIIQQNKSMEKLQIISPMANKGLGREYFASEVVKDESNYIEIGLVVYDHYGDVDRNTQVVVMATDSSQNKTMNGTGTIGRIYENGVKKEVYYYPFTYEFKTAGEHTITFSANGMTEVVKLTAK